MNEARPLGLFEHESNQRIPQGMLKDYGAAEQSFEGISLEEMLKHFPTRDENMIKILEIVRTVAPTRVPILITGESGIGKELLSKTVHMVGAVERGRFVCANCSSIPQNFFDLEIFMIQNGEFRKPIDNCTLVLDEVCELDLNMQLKLLKVLKDQENSKGLLRKGTALDSRIVACTSRDLQDEVNAQRFRSELFYKLHVITLEIPPLRERTVDIDFYAEIFVREFNVQFSKNVGLSPTAKQAMRTYSWPGNVRELRNVIQRAVLLSTGSMIGVEELHLVKANSRTEQALQESLPPVTIRELEQRLIIQTLRRYNGNRTHTAKALGISLRALRYKLNELVDCGYEVEGKNA